MWKLLKWQLWNKIADASDIPLPHLKASTAEAYFEAVRGENTQFEKIAGERPDLWLYIHGPAHYEATKYKREAAVLLPAAESFTTFAACLRNELSSYPRRAFDRAWMASIYPDHGLGGKNGEITDAIFEDSLKVGRDEGQKLLSDALQQITEEVNTHPDNYIVFNINFTSISKNQIQKVLLTIDKFCARTQLKAVILEAISSYKSLHIDIKRFLQNNPNIKYISRLSINETGTLLMQARFFIGSSLHCAITSLASNKPAALIHISPLSKFQDLYGHIMMTEYLSNSWDDFIPLLHLLYDFNQHSLLNKYIQFMQSCFDNKMDLLIYKINNYIKNKTILENQII